MACQYWYDNAWRSEEEFKEILNNGLLDKLIKEKKVDLPEFQYDEQKAKTFGKVTKGPITLRILQKIQRQINNQRVPVTGEFVNNNPMDIIKDYETQTGTKMPFNIVIKVDGVLRAGENKAGEKLLSQLQSRYIRGLKEGIPYMLVPSAYGLYPMQLKSHKIKDTEAYKGFKTALINLKSENTQAVFIAKKAIEKSLYRTSVDYNATTQKYTIIKYDNALKQYVKQAPKDLDAALDYLGDQLYRCDYTRINKGDYNQTLAKAGAISTDLYVDNGSFFHSSSFVIEAYGLTQDDKDVLAKTFTVEYGDTSASNATAATFNAPNQTTTALPIPEDPIFQASVQEVNDAASASPGITREIFVGKNSTYPFARVTGNMVNGKFEVTDITMFNKQRRANANDLKTFSNTKPTNAERNAAIKDFFKDPDVKKFAGKETSTTPETEVETKVESKGSLIKNTLASMIASEEEALMQEGITVGSQELSDLIAQANDNVIVNEETAEEVVPAIEPEVAPVVNMSLPDLNVDLDGLDLQDPSVKLKSNTTENLLGNTNKKEIARLTEILGEKVTKRGKKGKLRLFQSVESLQKYLPKETYEMLLEANRQGKYLHGLFTDAAWFLSQNAESGTAYHEAFHIVFNLALPLKTRINIINQTIKDNRSEFNEDLNKITFLEVEEFLADKFQEYAMANEDMPVKEETKSFFKGLNRMLKTFFVKNAPITVDQLFEDINTGVYKNKIEFRSKKSYFRTKQSEPGFNNPALELYSFQYMSTVLDLVLNNYRNQDPSNQFKDDSTVISELGVNKVFGLIASYVYKSAQTAKDPLMRNRFVEFFNVLTNNGQNIKQIQVENNSLLQFSASTKLLERFASYLKVRGLHIDITNVKASKDTASDEVLNIDPEENTFEESWMKGHIEINPAESVSQRIKSFFATIPKYVSNRANARPSYGAFGVIATEDPAAVFKYVISKISNSYTTAEMMAKLEKVKTEKPYIKDIIERLEKDPILKTEVFNTIASKNYATFVAVQEESGNYKVFNSNRKTLDNVIKDQLINDFLVQDNPIFNKDPKTGTKDFTSINVENAKKIHKSLEAIHNWAATRGANTSRQDLENSLTDFTEDLRKIKINLTLDNLLDIWQPERGAASWNNVVALMGEFVKLADQFTTGENPLINLTSEQTVDDRDSKKKGRNIVERIAKKLMPALNNEVISSFRNIDNKTVYNLILSGYINKLFSKFTDFDKFQEWYKSVQNDPLISQMPFVKDLADEENDLQNILDVAILDGLTRKGKNRAVSYSDMSDIEMTATDLAMFFNQDSRNKARFKLPIPSDSPTMMYVQAQKLEKEEVIEKLLQTARAEHSRIKNLRLSKEDSILRLIPNYFNKGTKFQILSFLNNSSLRTDRAFDADIAREAIVDFLDNQFIKNELVKFKREGVIKSISENGKYVFAEKVVDSRIKNPTEFFNQYLYNQYYMNTQLSTVIGGDPAFYKNTTDFQKRFKQVLSPGMYTNTDDIPETYNSIVLKDSIKPTDKKTSDIIQKLVDKSNIPDSEKLKLKILWSTVLSNDSKGNKSYKGNNETDGATLISIDRMVNIYKSLGRFTDAHEESAKRIKAGNETIEDIAMFPPIKPFMYTQRLVDIGVVVPTQVKNSETLLTKSMAYAKDEAGNYLYPELIAAYDVLTNGYNNQTIDSLTFESAIKVGSLGSEVENGKIKFASFEQGPDGSYQLAENASILSLPTEDWRLQQETPPHYVDDMGNFGTQLRNLIIADLDLEGNYTINNRTYKGKEVAKLYQDLIATNIQESFEEVKEMFENKDGSINYERLVTELRKEVLDRDLNQEYLDAIELTVQTIKGKQELRPQLPLYHPLISYKMEALMNSFFKNRVTKQKIRGGALINTTSFGVSKNLKMIVDPVTGSITYQAMLPATSKKFFPKDGSGKVDIEFIKEHAPELLRIIAQRIPNEDKYSTFNIEVVGFTPPAMGGVVILPIEATTIAGLDFDIDKLYFMSRAFTVDKNGIPRYTKYLDQINNEAEALEAARNIYSNFESYKRFVKQTVSPDKVEQMLEGRRDLIDQHFEAIKNKKDLFESTEHVELYNQIQKLKKELKYFRKTDEEVAKALQDTVDDLYKELEDGFLPFNAQLSKVDEKQKEVVEFIKTKLLEGKLSIIALNSKSARDNRILELMTGILENKNTTMSILDIGGFDNLILASSKVRLLKSGMTIAEINKLSAEEINEKSDELDEGADFNINYPSTQLELFKRNMTGKQLIGIFANHNTHHAKAQFTNLQLKEPILFNDTEYKALNKILNDKGIRISKALASDLAAVVDNAKNPLSSFLNINTFTANTIALLQRLGIEEDAVFAFINQPVIIELTQKYFNERGALTDDKHFNAVRLKWKKLLEKKIEEKGGEAVTDGLYNFKTEELQQYIAGGESLEYYQLQHDVLNAFENFYDIAKELALGIQAAKADTTGVGPSSATNFSFLMTMQKIRNKIARGTNMIEGLESIYIKETDQTMIPAFTEYGIVKPISILNKIFPSIGSVDVSGNITYSVLGKIKEEFDSNKGMYGITEKESQLVDSDFISYLGSGFPFFDYSQAENILVSIPDRVTKFKAKMQVDEPYALFINKLNPVAPDKTYPIKRIEFYNTGKTSTENYQIIKAWERMMMDPDPEVKQLALDLVKYTYFANGYSFGPFTFFNMIPVTFWTDKFQKENNILSKKGLTFNSYLEEALAVDLTKENKVKRFIKQFIQNNGDRENFVTRVADFEAIPALDATMDKVQRLFIASQKAFDVKSGVLQIGGNTLIVNQFKNQGLKTATGKPVDFVKVRDKKGNTKIFEYVPNNDLEQQDPMMYGGITAKDAWMYKEIPLTGMTNFIKEYNIHDDIKDPIVSKVKKTYIKTPNVPVIPKQTTAQKIASSFEDEIAEVERQMIASDLGAIIKPTIAPQTPTETAPKTPPSNKPPLSSLIASEEESRQQLEGGFGLISWLAYQEAGGNKLTREQFLSLDIDEQAAAVWQAKNCKK